jgi:CDGSH-type Zn-finger protein
MTHTYATLEVSALAYDEIAAKLRAAGYDHAFDTDEGAIDMQGIGLVRAAPTHRHVKRGTLYDVLGQAELQSSGGPVPERATLTVYRGADDGKLWARPQPEFEDGRFDGPGASTTRAVARLNAEVDAAGGLDAWRAHAEPAEPLAACPGCGAAIESGKDHYCDGAPPSVEFHAQDTEAPQPDREAEIRQRRQRGLVGDLDELVADVDFLLGRVATVREQRDIYKGADLAMQEQCSVLRVEMDEMRAKAIDDAKPIPPRRLDEWNEEDGAVVWWKFPVCEPAWIGHPNCDDWPDDFYTHWTPHPALPQEPTQ